jgi:CO/xanthine dehydrogenase Mo-binding subunit
MQSGAYVSTAGVGINTNNFARCLPGMYRIPKIDVSVACYFSNTIPIGPYRGAGRPKLTMRLSVWWKKRRGLSEWIRYGCARKT